MAEVTSLSLLQRVQQGTEESSWFEFMHLYNGLIEGWLKKQGVQHADAEDIRQEVMTVVHGELQKFDHNGRTGAFRTWLRRITANRMHEHLRKKARTNRTGAPTDLGVLADQLNDDASELAQHWDAEHDSHVVDFLLLRVSTQFSSEQMDAFRKVTLEGLSPARGR